MKTFVSFFFKQYYYNQETQPKMSVVRYYNEEEKANDANTQHSLIHVAHHSHAHYKIKRSYDVTRSYEAKQLVLPSLFKH